MKRAISLSNQSERPGDSQSKKQLDTQKMLEMLGKLHRAIQSKNTQLMQDILKNYTRNLDEIQDEDGNNLVILAAMQGDWRMLEILLTKAINPNKKNKHGNTALHYAVLNRNAKCIDALIQNQVDESIENDQGETAWEMCQQELW